MATWWDSLGRMIYGTAHEDGAVHKEQRSPTGPVEPPAPQVDIVFLGTGAGVTHVYKQECSSAFAVLQNDAPVLLCDVGFGVVASCLKHVGSIPRNVYCSHNHSDHAAELPVLLAVEHERGPLALYAHPEVMGELREHRLRELRSTGTGLDTFASFCVVMAGCTTHIGDTGLSVRPHRSRHSEACYGFVLYSGHTPVLGWTADSAYDEELYAALAEAPLVVVDGRAAGGSEHASFEEIAQFAASPAMAGKRLIITGYGRQDEAPVEGALPGALVARPGLRITLTPPASSPASVPASAPPAAAASPTEAAPAH